MQVAAWDGGSVVGDLGCKFTGVGYALVQVLDMMSGSKYTAKYVYMYKHPLT